MQTLEQFLASFEPTALDGRDIGRLADFIPQDQWHKYGLKVNPDFKGTHTTQEWTRENILTRLERDTEFAFEKALDKRGISASLMWGVVMMWNNILQEGLEDWPDNDYAQYGLPLFKATALKYNWHNPIGDDEGDEYEYSSEGD